MAKKVSNPFDDASAMPDLDDVFKSKPNEAFTKDELRTIEDLSNEYPAIRKLADRYALVFSKPDVEFYAALAFAAKYISTLIFNEELDLDNTKHKAMMAVLEKGGAYYKSLQAGKEKSGNPESEEEVEGAEKPVKQIGSVAERYANRGDKS